VHKSAVLLLKRPVQLERTSQQCRVIFEREEPVHDTPAHVLFTTPVDCLVIQYSVPRRTVAPKKSLKPVDCDLLQLQNGRSHTIATRRRCPCQMCLHASVQASPSAVHLQVLLTTVEIAAVTLSLTLA